MSNTDYDTVEASAPAAPVNVTFPATPGQVTVAASPGPRSLESLGPHQRTPRSNSPHSDLSMGPFQGQYDEMNEQVTAAMRPIKGDGSTSSTVWTNAKAMEYILSVGMRLTSDRVSKPVRDILKKNGIEDPNDLIEFLNPSAMEDPDVQALPHLIRGKLISMACCVVYYQHKLETSVVEPYVWETFGVNSRKLPDYYNWYEANKDKLGNPATKNSKRGESARDPTNPLHSTKDTEVETFKRGQKRDKNNYPQLKDEAFWPIAYFSAQTTHSVEG